MWVFLETFHASLCSCVRASGAWTLCLEGTEVMPPQCSENIHSAPWEWSEKFKETAKNLTPPSISGQWKMEGVSSLDMGMRMQEGKLNLPPELAVRSDLACWSWQRDWAQWTNCPLWRCKGVWGVLRGSSQFCHELTPDLIFLTW